MTSFTSDHIGTAAKMIFRGFMVLSNDQIRDLDKRLSAKARRVTGHKLGRDSFEVLAESRLTIDEIVVRRVRKATS